MYYSYYSYSEKDFFLYIGTGIYDEILVCVVIIIIIIIHLNAAQSDRKMNLYYINLKHTKSKQLGVKKQRA